MAFRWRIRHKLMLGLGLVVAIMALLVGGTLKGLTSYRATTRTMDRKLVELPTEWPDFSLADFVRKVTAQPEPKVSTAAL